MHVFLKSSEPPQAVYISRTVGIHCCLHALSGLWRHLSHGGSHVGAKSRAAATCSCPTHPPPTSELLRLTPTVSQLVGVTVTQELLWPLIISSCVCALIIPPCWWFLCPLLMYVLISCVSCVLCIVIYQYLVCLDLYIDDYFITQFSWWLCLYSHMNQKAGLGAKYNVWMQYNYSSIM